MKRIVFNAYVNQMIGEVLSRLIDKGQEYSPDEDRLSNFRKAAIVQGTTMEAALMGMAIKHFISVIEMCQDDGQLYTRARWKEKVGDSIAYLLILWAMTHEEDAQDHCCNE